MLYKESNEKYNKLSKTPIAISKKNLDKKLLEAYNIFLNEILSFDNRGNDLFDTLILDSFYQFVILESIVNVFENQNEVTIVDIGTGLGIPSIPIILAFKELKPKFLQKLRFYLIEPKQRKVEFLKNVKKIFDLCFEVINSDEKSFYSKYRKKFDIVFCRAVFSPPKIFDIFKKFSQKLSFWQYSENYISVLNTYKNKIQQNKLEVFKIYTYEIGEGSSKSKHFTVVFQTLPSR